MNVRKNGWTPSPTQIAQISNPLRRESVPRKKEAVVVKPLKRQPPRSPDLRIAGVSPDGMRPLAPTTVDRMDAVGRQHLADTSARPSPRNSPIEICKTIQPCGCLQLPVRRTQSRPGQQDSAHARWNLQKKNAAPYWRAHEISRGDCPAKQGWTGHGRIPFLAP